MTPRPPFPGSTEKQIQAGIVRLLRTLGVAVYDLSQPRRTMQTAGLPDLYVLHRGRAAWVEVKGPGGRLSGAQQEFRRRCGEAGVEHHVWTSSEAAVEWVRERRT